MDEKVTRTVPAKKSPEETDRLMKKLMMISMFSAGIAHDYNNALTAVMGNISLSKFEAEGNRELMELLSDAEKASIRIKEMTERLSTFTRGIKLLKSRTDFVALVRPVFDRLVQDHRGTHEFIAAENIPSPEADPGLLEVAVECIILNSLEAAPEGAVEVSVSTTEVDREQNFREMSLVAGNYIRLSVKDNGSGIDKGSMKSLFNPYFTTKEGHDGTGLALAYSILKRHHGFISVESSAAGTVFTLFVPLF